MDFFNLAGLLSDGLIQAGVFVVFGSVLGILNKNKLSIIRGKIFPALTNLVLFAIKSLFGMHVAQL